MKLLWLGICNIEDKRTADELDLATLFWVHWFNHDRLRSANGYRTPIEYEIEYQYLQTSAQAAVALGSSTLHQTRGGSLGARSGVTPRND